MIRSFILAFLLCAASVVAQAPWPGQAGDPVGYTNYASGTVGTSTCPASPASGTAGAPTIVQNCKYTGNQTFNQTYLQLGPGIDFVGSGGSDITISGSNIEVVGDRIQSNSVGNDALNVTAAASSITIHYNSFVPLVSFYTSPPGSLWPSAGSGTNSTLMCTTGQLTLGCNGSLNNTVDGGQGYQFGIKLVSGVGSTVIDHNDFWGYGDAIVFQGTNSGAVTITDNWIHDVANPAYSSVPAGVTISAFTGTSGTLTFTTSAQTYTAGVTLVLYGFTGGNTGLNGQTVTVLSAGLSSTTFEATVTGSGYSSGTGGAQGAGQQYHTDGIGYLNGGAGPSNVVIQHNTVALLGNTNALALQAATSGYVNLQIRNNYWSGDSDTIAWCEPGSTLCTNSAFSANVYGTDIPPELRPIYGFSATPGTGSTWTSNTINFLAGTTWTTGAGSWTPLIGMQGQYFNPTNPPNSATDNGGNTHSGLLVPSTLSWQPGAVASQTITLTAGNTGNLGITSIVVSSQYSQTNTCGATLVNGASCAVTVTYQPTGTGPVPGTLTITDTDPSSPQIVSLLGIDAPSVAPASVPYCGVSADTSIHLPTNYDTLLPPALGGSYVDPTFGCTITRLTDAVNHPGSQTCAGGGTNCQGKHFYSTVPPDNVTHSMVHALLDGLPSIIAGPVSTYAAPGTILVKQSNFPTANLTSQEFVVWDIQDPLTFYYTATNQFIMAKVTGLPLCAALSTCTITSTVLGTFSSYTSVSLMADEDISEDGLHYYIGAHSGGAINDGGCSSPGQLCDLVTVTLNGIGGTATTATLGTVILSNTYWHKVQAALANRLQVEAPGGVNTFTEYNTNGTAYATLPTSHHDFLHNPADNSESMVGAWNSGSATLNVCGHHNGFGEVSTSTTTMLNCLMEVFLPATAAFGIPPGQFPASHISTRDIGSGWAIFEAESYQSGGCPLSTDPYCEPGISPAVTNMTNWGLYDGELVALKADGSQLLRLAHHHSHSGAGYWAGSRAVISRDAKYIYFDSNFDSCPTSAGCGAQTATSDPSYTDLYVLQFANPAALPSLPTTWVNNNEGNKAFSYELVLGASSWITGPPPTCTFSLPYAVSTVGLQSAINALEACRTLTGVGIALDIPPGLYTNAATNGIIIPQSNTVASSNFLVLRSTMDSHLPNGQTVCAHGIQDNLATSIDPGLINPDCAGDVMAYQLAATVTSITVGGFTLANGIATNTSAYNDVQYMWTAECSGANCSALDFCSPLGASSTSVPPLCSATVIGPDHWLIEDGEVRMQAGNTGNQNFVNMSNTGSETSTTQLSSHIHLRKMWVHGDWTSLIAGANSVSADFNLSCIYCSIVDSQASESLRPGSEGHIVNTQFASQLKIDHNWFEGQSSPIISGGFTTNIIATLVPFQDIEIRRNRLTFPYAWLGQITIPGGNTNWSGQNIVRKTGYENKVGVRVLLSGNLIDNVDNSGGQGGPLSDFNIRNTSAGGHGTNYQMVISDYTLQNNIFRNSCEGFETDRSESSGGNGGGVTFPVQRMWFSNNLFYNTTISNPGCVGVTNRGIDLDSSGQSWQGTITGNGTQATFVANCSVDAGGCPGQVASLAVGSAGTGCVAGNLVFSSPAITTGILATGTYTCSSGALSTLTLSNPGSGYTSAATATLATGTGTVTVTMVSVAVAPPVGFEVTDISPGDPVSVLGCTSVAAFNIATQTYGGGHILPSGIGPLASASTVPASLTVIWPSSTNATDSAGFCTVANIQGGPHNFSWTHNTVISDSTRTISSANALSGGTTPGPNFQAGTLLTNSIFVGGSGGWDNSVVGTGTPTELFNYDVTSMTANYMVWPGQTASLYTEYGNNPSFSAACTGVGCSPPSTIYFPTNSYCSGGSPTSACIGFLGAMSAGSMPLTLSDYHQYALISGSSFKSGGTEQASDGTDMGVNMSAIDPAQTQNLYVCGTACGSSGPFPDTNLAPAVAPATALFAKVAQNKSLLLAGGTR